jgi:sigma-B regulation protein RsbU (phosphoserine phosphatase)
VCYSPVHPAPCPAKKTMPTGFRLLPASRTAPATDGAAGGLRGFARRRAGKVLLGSLLLLGLQLAGVPLPDLVYTLNWVVLVVLGPWALYRLGRYLVRTLLWRIRSKLLVSYLFIAVVPLVLLTGFFVLAGFLGLSLVASYTVSSEVERVAQELLTVGKSALAGARPPTATVAREAEDRLSEARTLYPRLAWALVRDGKTVASSPGAALSLPAWFKGPAFAGLAKTRGTGAEGKEGGGDAAEEGSGGDTTSMRAVWAQDGAVLLLDVPLDESVFGELKRRTGIAVIDSSEQPLDSSGPPQPKKGITIHVGDHEREEGKKPQENFQGEFRTSEGVLFLAVPEVTDWSTGRREVKPIGIRYNPSALVRRLSPASMDIGGVLVTAMAVVGGLFLVVYCVALVRGLMQGR